MRVTARVTGSQRSKSDSKRRQSGRRSKSAAGATESQREKGGGAGTLNPGLLAQLGPLLSPESWHMGKKGVAAKSGKHKVGVLQSDQ